MGSLFVSFCTRAERNVFIGGSRGRLAEPCKNIYFLHEKCKKWSCPPPPPCGLRPPPPDEISDPGSAPVIGCGRETGSLRFRCQCWKSGRKDKVGCGSDSERRQSCWMRFVMRPMCVGGGGNLARSGFASDALFSSWADPVLVKEPSRTQPERWVQFILKLFCKRWHYLQRNI